MIDYAYESFVNSTCMELFGFGQKNQIINKYATESYMSRFKEDTLFFVSTSPDMDGKILSPRIPKNFFTENGYEDNKTPRVCFSPSVRQSLMGINCSKTGTRFYVYSPEDISAIKKYLVKPDKKSVPDVEITNEIWCLSKVKIKRVGVIETTASVDKPHPFKYGDNTAELYEWKFKWVEKYKTYKGDKSMNELRHADETLTDAGKLRKQASENMKNADTQNLEKFGKDREHNILYISGKSGSGKSTVALSMKDEKTDVIHLDSYFELHNKNSMKNQNLNFNIFLRNHSFDPTSLNDENLFRSNIKEYFRKVDRFTKLSEEFGRHSFDIQRKVIMEGVQLLDETMYPDKSFLADKPRIVLNINDSTAKKRASERDKWL